MSDGFSGSVDLMLGDQGFTECTYGLSKQSINFSSVSDSKGNKHGFGEDACPLPISSNRSHCVLNVGDTPSLHDKVAVVCSLINIKSYSSKQRDVLVLCEQNFILRQCDKDIPVPGMVINSHKQMQHSHNTDCSLPNIVCYDYHYTVQLTYRIKCLKGTHTHTHT
jgi:hypothetical protein